MRCVETLSDSNVLKFRFRRTRNFSFAPFFGLPHVVNVDSFGSRKSFYRNATANLRVKLDALSPLFEILGNVFVSSVFAVLRITQHIFRIA